MQTRYYLTFITILFTSLIFAQDVKGEISYDVYFSSDKPEAQAYMERMENSSMTVYFTDGKLRTDFFMGDIMTTKSISLKEQDSTLVLLDGMMGRIAMPISHKEMEEEDDSQSQRLVPDDAQIEFIDETKDLIGYTCKKAIITNKDGDKTELWYTEDILPSYRIGQFLSEKIPGTPLEIKSNTFGMEMRMVAYKFKNKLKKEAQIFSTEIPKGYVIKTPEEMKQLNGQRQ